MERGQTGGLIAAPKQLPPETLVTVLFTAKVRRADPLNGHPLANSVIRDIWKTRSPLANLCGSRFAQRLDTRARNDMACVLLTGTSSNFDQECEAAPAVVHKKWRGLAHEVLGKMNRLTTRQVDVTFPRHCAWRAPVRAADLATEHRPVLLPGWRQVRRLCEQAGLGEVRVCKTGGLFFVFAQPRRDTSSP